MPPSRPLAPDSLVQHHAALMRIAQRVVVDRASAEDAVQDAYVAALEHKGPAPARPNAWMMGVVKNNARRLLRSRARRRTRQLRVAQPESLPSTVEVAARTEAQRHLADAIACLEEPGRTAIVLRYFDDLKTAEIARRSGVPVRTIESRLRRARAALGAMLDDVYRDKTMHGKALRWERALVPTWSLWQSAAGSQALTTGASTTTATSTAGTQVAGTQAAGAALTAGTHGAVLGTAASLIGGSIVGTKAIIVIAAAVGAIGFFAGSEVQKRSSSTSDSHMQPDVHDDVLLASHDESSSDLEDRAPTLENDESTLEGLRRKLVSVEAKRVEAEEETSALRGELEKLRKQIAGTDSTSSTEDKPGVAFGFDLYGGGLKNVDWDKAGVSFANMRPMMLELHEMMASGKDMSSNPDLMRKIQAQNTHLIHVASAAHQTGVPGGDINAAFTHPVVYVNLVDATLRAADRPLSEEQLAELVKLGENYIKEVDAVAEMKKTFSLALEGLIADSEVKERFFAAVDDVTTTEQRDILHPPSVRGLVGFDLMSGGLVWQTKVAPTMGTNVDSLVAQVASTVRGHLQITEADTASVESACKQFVDSFPSEFLVPITRTQLRLIQVSDALLAAKKTAELLKELQRTLPTEHKAIGTIKMLEHAILPRILKVEGK